MQPETRTASVHFKIPLCSCFIAPSAFLEHPTQVAVPTPSFHCSRDDPSGSTLSGTRSVPYHQQHFTLHTTPSFSSSWLPRHQVLPVFLLPPAASFLDSRFLNFCPY